MGKNKMGRPSWFKLFLHHKSLIDAVPDEVAGRALKAALRYFDTGEVVELDSLAGAVFAALKPHIDEAFADFQATSEKNRQNIQKRWANRGVPSDTTGNHSLPNDTKNTEAEAEAEAETEGEEEGEGRCSFRQGFTPPTVEEVTKYCDDNNYSFDPRHFESYYRGKGWMLGNTPMMDWKAVADGWQHRENEKQSPSRPKHPPISGVPTL